MRKLLLASAGLVGLLYLAGNMKAQDTTQAQMPTATQRQTYPPVAAQESAGNSNTAGGVDLTKVSGVVLCNQFPGDGGSMWHPVYHCYPNNHRMDPDTLIEQADTNGAFTQWYLNLSAPKRPLGYSGQSEDTFWTVNKDGGIITMKDGSPVYDFSLIYDEGVKESLAVQGISEYPTNFAISKHTLDMLVPYCQRPGNEHDLECDPVAAAKEKAVLDKAFADANKPDGAPPAATGTSAAVLLIGKRVDNPTLALLSASRRGRYWTGGEPATMAAVQNFQCRKAVLSLVLVLSGRWIELKVAMST
jgi:hypothetical protein